MRINNFGQQSVGQINDQFHNDDVLRARHISATSRFSLDNAAAATSVNTDELLAVMDYRLRRSAQHVSVAEAEEAELVA